MILDDEIVKRDLTRACNTIRAVVNNDTGLYETTANSVESPIAFNGNMLALAVVLAKQLLDLGHKDALVDAERAIRANLPSVDVTTRPHPDDDNYLGMFL